MAVRARARDRPVHWLLVSARHHPDHGGIGAYVRAFAKAAVAAGWRLELMTRRGDDMPPASRIHIVRTADEDAGFGDRVTALRRIERIRPYRYGLWSLAVARELLEIDCRPDVIEFVDCQGEGYVSMCDSRVRSRFAGVPMIVHAHTPMYVGEAMNGEDASRFGRSIYYEWERMAIDGADGVLVPTRLLRDHMRLTRAAVLPLPLDLDDTGIATTGNGAERIVLMGAVQPLKGVDVWARSLNRVLARRRNASAVLVGPDTNTAPDGGSMVDYAAQLLEPPFRDRFASLGTLEHKEAMRVLESASIVVVPSRLENFSYVAAEAIVRRRPIIISDRAGMAEYVKGLRTVPAGDPEALAEAQLRILEQPEESAVLAEAHRGQLIEACSPARFLGERESFVRSLDATDRTVHGGKGGAVMERMESLLAEIEEAEQSETMGLGGGRAVDAPNHGM